MGYSNPNDDSEHQDLQKNHLDGAGWVGSNVHGAQKIKITSFVVVVVECTKMFTVRIEVMKLYRKCSYSSYEIFTICFYLKRYKSFFNTK